MVAGWQHPAHHADDDKTDPHTPVPIVNVFWWSTTALLAVPVLASAVYYVLGVKWVRLWMEERPPHDASKTDRPPVTFFRPLKSGVPDLRGKLELLVRAMEARDQLLLGVEDGSAEAVIAGEVRAAHPQVEVLVVPCAPGQAVNPKISKLVQMEAAARHEHWILSDSETRLDADFLPAFRDEWRECEVLTAAYRVSGATAWPQRLDAASTLLTLWPGLAVLRANQAVRLTLGACTGFRRTDLQAVGGWAAFGEDLAEDHRLGTMLAAQGCRVRLSRSVVTLESDPLTWRDYWRHQRRVAITYRVASPAGFAGAGLAQGIAAVLALLACWPGSWWTWTVFALILGLRWMTARRLAQLVAFPLPVTLSLILVASLVESVCWLLSWPARRVWWGGTHWHLDARGRLRRPS